VTWDRLLWGVTFTGGMVGDKPSLIGTHWMRPTPEARYDDEPTRPLLFCTRAAAREWCRVRVAEYAGRTDSCGKWKFRPVRVRELVTMSNE